MKYILKVLFISVGSFVGRNLDNITYCHCVNLSFDLLIPCQGSLQTFLGVQLRVSSLINVSTNTWDNKTEAMKHR